jgi:serine/threonine protein kinase
VLRIGVGGAARSDEGAGFDGPQWAKVSPEARSLVRTMMYRDAGLRPSAVQALDHPWLRDVGNPNPNGVVRATPALCELAWEEYTARLIDPIR